MSNTLNISQIPREHSKSHDLSQSCNNQSIRKTLPRQAFWEKNFTLAPQIEQDVYEYFKSLHPSQKKTFDYYLMLSTRCRHMFPTQEHIANKTRMCVRQVQRNIKKFVEDGVLLSNYRHMTSCEYRINPFFHTTVVQNIIRSISKGVKFIALALLMPFSRYQSNELSSYFTGSCRTKTLKRDLYINLNNIHLSPLSRLARAWKLPREATANELTESMLIVEHNEKQRRDPFSPVVRRLSMLFRLTRGGMVDIMQYPEQALNNIETLWGKLDHKPENILRWIHGMCTRYCKEKNLYIDYNFARKLRKALGIHEDEVKTYSLYTKSLHEEKKLSRQYGKSGEQLNVDLNRSSNELSGMQSELNVICDNDIDYTQGDTTPLRNEMNYHQQEIINFEQSNATPGHNEINLLKKEGNNAYAFGAIHPPVTKRDEGSSYQTRSFSREQSIPPRQSAPFHKSKNLAESSHDAESTGKRYYNPTSGTYSMRDPQSTISSKVRAPSGPPAPPEEAKAHIDNILAILSGKMAMPDVAKKPTARDLLPEEISAQLDSMQSAIKNYRRE